MPNYEVSVDGVATLEYTDGEGNTQSERVRDETVTVSTLPEVTSDGPVVVSITPTREVLASYDMPADAFDDELTPEQAENSDESGREAGGGDV